MPLRTSTALSSADRSSQIAGLRLAGCGEFTSPCNSISPAARMPGVPSSGLGRPAAVRYSAPVRGRVTFSRA